MKLWRDEDSMNIKKSVVIYIIILFVISSACLMLIASNAVTIAYNGFAIDSSGILYLGKNAKIEKYFNGEIVGNIDPQTSRGYAFTIQNDDTMLVSDASIVYKLELNGNIVDSWKDIGTQTFNEMHKKEKSFVTNSGKIFLMKSKMGRVSIVSEDGNCIYKMPMLDYIVKVLLFFIMLSLLIVILIEIRRFF